MPKPLRPRTAALLVAMVAALCAIALVARSWRPLMARFYCNKLLGDAALARDALGRDLEGYRQDGLSRYLRTDEGSRLLCDALLSEALRREQQVPGRQEMLANGVFIGVWGGLMCWLRPGLPEDTGVRDALQNRLGGGPPWDSSYTGFALRISSDDSERLERLFSRAALVPSEVSATDPATGIVLTVKPAVVSKDHMVHVGKKGDN